MDEGNPYTKKQTVQGNLPEYKCPEAAMKLNLSRWGTKFVFKLGVLYQIPILPMSYAKFFVFKKTGT